MADPTEVDAADPAKKNSEVLGPSSDEATVQMSELDQTCYWNDTEFQQGQQVISGGKKFECSFGKWVPID